MRSGLLLGAKVDSSLTTSEQETLAEGMQRPPVFTTSLALEHKSQFLSQSAKQTVRKRPASKTSPVPSRPPRPPKFVSSLTSPAYAHSALLLTQSSETMEAARASEFPKFSDGDVQVLISSNKTYQLHSVTLRRASPFFAYLLDSEAPADLCSPARKAGRSVRYRFELARPVAPGSGVGVFQRTAVTKWGEPASRVVCFSDIDNGKISNEQNQHWDWLFGVFYNKSPEFDNANLATTLSGCMGLVDVAESVHAVDLVRPVVDLALLRQNNVLWTSIASNPIAWAELGRRVHSPTIFREGVVHVVGKWNHISATDKAELHPDIREICQRKFDEIDIAKEVIELRILGHYPDFLCRNAVDRPGRPTYSADIYMWMAICFYRQWFAQAISDGRNRLGPDGGYEFYHQIGAGGQAYLNHESFKNFHQYFPMSSKACNVLEANMNIMKEDVKKFVADILINRTSVDPKTYPLQWLTCALVLPEDFPWYVTEEDAKATGNGDFMEELEPVTPIPHRPLTKKRRRQTDEYTNGYTNGVMTPADSSVNDGDYRADDEE